MRDWLADRRDLAFDAVKYRDAVKTAVRHAHLPSTTAHAAAIHPGQCGVLVYVADVLASAFVVPHPADYRVLHSTLVRDLFGELIYQYGLMTLPVREFTARIADTRRVSALALRAVLPIVRNTRLTPCLPRRAFHGLRT